MSNIQLGQIEPRKLQVNQMWLDHMMHSYSSEEIKILDELVAGIARAFRQSGSGCSFQHELAGTFQLFLNMEDLYPNLELVGSGSCPYKLLMELKTELSGDIDRIVQANRVAESLEKCLPSPEKQPSVTDRRRL